MRNLHKTLGMMALFAAVTPAGFAQYVPSHPKYVTYIDDDKSFYQYFPTWEPGDKLSADENFFISRVKIKDRFVNRNTQVVPDDERNNQRKFSLCTPMGISDTYWQTLPRYVMDGDNFSMWSYLDSQGGWSQSWIRTVGAYSDVCHKNGVANSGGVIFFDSWGGDNTIPQATVNILVEKNPDGSFKYLEKFIKFIRYYGVDGVTFNPEGYIAHADLLQDFLAAVIEEAPKYDWQFHVYWYGANSNNGYLNLSSVLNSGNSNWFIKNGKTVTDVYFLNYDWSSSINTSIQTAEGLRKGSTNNLYAGFDIQGNWLARGNWSRIKNTDISIIFWGNHTTDMIYQNSTEFGSTDEAVQKCYLQKQEEVFSGGNRNPAATPALVAGGVQQSSSAAMKKFHGIAALMPARSSLQELPFITRFSLGNGKVFRNEGEVTFRNKWYSLSSQDYLPTWRWWITDHSGNVPADAITCGFTFDDSWYAGSCMEVKGATKASDLRLFKTNFNVKGGDELRFVYKLNGKDGASHARLFWSFVGSEQDFHYADLPDAESGAWHTFSTTAGAAGMEGNVALIGISYDDTPADYHMLLGEFAIVPDKAYTPVKPTVSSTEFLERTFNSVSYKIIWDCKPLQAKSDASLPVYNDDIDTWYFEVYSQAEGGEPKLDGVTTSWAHYVVGAFSDPAVKNYRFGVRAVSPDGKTASEIAWGDWQAIEATMVEGISIDRPVVKSGETFTVGYDDPLHSEAKKWEIVDPASGKTMFTQQGGNGFTTSIAELGTYDVVLTDAAGKRSSYRGFVQISPDATGSLPVINDFTAASLVLTDENPATAVNFDVRLGEGSVSHALKMEDANQFRIPKEALPKSQRVYSIGFWVKPDMFAHSKYGTNLINKRNVDRAWPHNNWGAFWVIVWPEWADKNGYQCLDANVISYTMYQSSNGSFAGNSNIHETPFTTCTTDYRLGAQETYALNPGTWTHVMISYDGSKQKIFFNGKKVCETSTNFVEYDESPVYIGGSNVYHAGINGCIDDVQVWHKALTEDEVKVAMMGYEGKTVPAELKAYYTFEDVQADGSFANLGSGGAALSGAYVQLVGAAGESTMGTTEVILQPDTDALGNPTLPGSLPITTQAELLAPGLETAVNGNQGTLRANAATEAGQHDVTLTLTNMWGKASLTKPGYITYDDAVGIRQVETSDDNADADAPIYNVAGQRVSQTTHGVYIIGGKRVVK